MRTGPTRVDELVAAIFPQAPLPAHLSPAHLLDADVEPPSKIAAKVLALRELIRRGGRPDDLVGQRIASSADVAALYLPRLRDDTMESLHVVGLDVRNHVRVMRCVARGGISSCAVAPRDLLRPLVLNACAAGILVHNHPSGEPSPSADDIALTERVVSGARLLGINVVDHIIVSAGGAFSLLDAGLLPRA